MGHELRTERELSLDFLSVCEAAAIASARTMGQGDRKFSDHVAVEAMRKTMDSVPMRGRIVIGEGEGVLTAAAMKCLNGEIQARLVYDPARLDVDKSKVPSEEVVLARLKEM